VSAEWLAAAVSLVMSHAIGKVGELLVVGFVWGVWGLTRMPAWGSTLTRSRCPANDRMWGGPVVRIAGSQLGGEGGRYPGAAAVFRCPREKESGCFRLLRPTRSGQPRVGSK